ncbi:hypothetical protein BDV93DRAFT_420187, partial [Ceratobasidium sp. AG-I]
SGEVHKGEGETANTLMREAVKGRVATGMNNGWKNIRRTLLLASMLSVDYKVNLYGQSAQYLSKTQTADNHLSIVLDDIDHSVREHGVRIIAWVSDAGGDSQGMR